MGKKLVRELGSSKNILQKPALFPDPMPTKNSPSSCNASAASRPDARRQLQASQSFLGHGAGKCHSQSSSRLGWKGRNNCEFCCRDSPRVRTDSGESIPALDMLASCGANGTNNNNERDLHRWLRGMRGLKLETYDICVELQVP